MAYTTGNAYTDKDGNKLLTYKDPNLKNNSSGSVSQGSTFDPSSKMYNDAVANSGGKIGLGGNLDQQQSLDRISNSMGNSQNERITRADREDNNYNVTPQGLSQAIAQQQIGGLIQNNPNNIAPTTQNPVSNSMKQAYDKYTGQIVYVNPSENYNKYNQYVDNQNQVLQKSNIAADKNGKYQFTDSAGGNFGNVTYDTDSIKGFYINPATGKMTQVDSNGNFTGTTLNENGSPSQSNQSNSKNYDPTNDINSLKEYQKQQALAGLTSARDSSLSNLAADREKIAPTYYNNRANTSTASQLGAKNLAEFMASRGQSSAGVAGQSELNRVNQLQGDIGNWNTQEQGELNANTRNVTNLNNAYNSDVASSNAGIEATGMQQLINAKNQQRAEQMAQSNADRSYNYQVGRDTVGDSRYNTETAYNQGRDTVADNRYNQQYTDQRGDVAYDRNYRTGRDTVADSQTAWQQRNAENQQIIDQANRNRDRDYQIGRDAISDTNYNNQTKYNQDRDAMGDVKWATEGNYRADQDKISQTGQLPNGQYTQSGQMNQLNIQQQQAQLAEMQDPNSTTNIMNRLGLQTAQLNFAALPAQLKAQAQQIAQELQRGNIDMRTAQIKLDYLPRQMQADLNQSQAQINATNRSNQGGGAGGGSSEYDSNGNYVGFNGVTSDKITPSQRRTATTKMAEAQEKNGTGLQWLEANGAEIKKVEGTDFYNSLVAKVKKTKVDPDIAYKNAKAVSQRENGNSIPQSY